MSACTSYLISSGVGYLLGALPFGWIVARAHGVDIFKAGSGNPGATNVKRVLGPRAGNTVFALDAAKGALAVGWMPLLSACGVAICSDDSSSQLGSQLIGLVAAVLGHSFSVFTKFKGGKGVATAAGGLVVLMPVACLCGLGVWLISFYSTRYVSLASILAAVAVPAASGLLRNPWPVTAVAGAVGLFIVIRHRSNISRLLAGTEPKFVKKAPPTPTGA